MGIVYMKVKVTSFLMAVSLQKGQNSFGKMLVMLFLEF